MNEPTILLDRSDSGVARLTLNRPEAANTIQLELAKELHQAALRLDRDPGVRSVLVRGAGRMFCAGGDLKDFHSRGDDLPRYLRELTAHLHAAVAILARIDAPVIAAVQGAAAGAGFSLAVSADVVVAAESARFVMAYPRAGVVPDGSITWTLPRLVGLRRALDLALTNRPLTAAEALEWGIVTRVVPDDRLDAEAEALASELAAGPTGSLGVAKRLLRSSLGRSLEEQMERESEAISAAAATHDGREGIAAFVEKREPRFRGTAG